MLKVICKVVETSRSSTDLCAPIFSFENVVPDSYSLTGASKRLSLQVTPVLKVLDLRILKYRGL